MPKPPQNKLCQMVKHTNFTYQRAISSQSVLMEVIQHHPPPSQGRIPFFFISYWTGAPQVAVLEPCEEVTLQIVSDYSPIARCLD